MNPRKAFEEILREARHKKAVGEHINKALRSLVSHFFGAEGKTWREQSRHDDTFALVFSDDQGHWPGRGGSRFTDIPALLRKSKGMPEDLPSFLRALHNLLKKFAADNAEDLRHALRGTNKISIRWLDHSGKKDEEWSIDINDEYDPDK